MDPTTARLILEWRIEDARQLEIARSAALGPYGHGAADAHEAIRILEAELDGLNVAGSEDGKDPEERLARSPEGPQSDGSEISEPFVDSQEYSDSASEAPKHADETQPNNKEVTGAAQEEETNPSHKTTNVSAARAISTARKFMLRHAHTSTATPVSQPSSLCQWRISTSIRLAAATTTSPSKLSSHFYHHSWQSTSKLSNQNSTPIRKTARTAIDLHAVHF